MHRNERGRVGLGPVPALSGRGVAKIKKGENADGEADVSAAKAIKPNVAEEFARYGISL